MDDLDLLAWETVRSDLTTLADATRNDRQTRPFAASALHRLAVLHLQAAVLREAESLTKGLEGATVEALQSALNDQLRGLPHAFAVLEALTPVDRGAAHELLQQARELDPDFVAAVRADVVMARVDARWTDAVKALEKLLEVDLRPKARAQTFETLGDLHWHNLDKRDSALGFLRAALDIEPAPERLDKLLKLNLELEHWEDAIDCCHQLIERVADDPSKAPLAVTYRLTLGEIYVYGKAEPGIALRHYLYARQLMPNYELTYTLLRELIASNPWSTLSAQYQASDVASESPAAFEALAAAMAAKQPPDAVIELLKGV